MVCHNANLKGGRWNRHHDVLTQIHTTAARYPPQTHPPYPAIQTVMKNRPSAAQPAEYSFQRENG
jgi:hypothetical protein